MKQLYTLLAAISLSYAVAQPGPLYENTWHLSYVNDNGTIYTPPNNWFVSGVNLQFYPDSGNIMTGVCDVISASALIDEVGFSFDSYNTTLGGCYGPPENASFQNVYFTFYVENLPNNNFTYQITETGDFPMLTVTSASNKQAVYSSVVLSASAIEKPLFSIYPNPTADYLILKSDNSAIDKGPINIYDSVGKLCKSHMLTSGEMRINTTSLTSGIYFVRIDTENGSLTQKIIKL